MTSWMRRTWRSVTADTIALMLFGLCAGALTLFFEMAIAGFTLGQWAGVHILYNALRFMGARFCGKLTDKVRRHFCGASQSRFRKAIADTLALACYQLPLYAFSALVLGVSIRQLKIAFTFHLAQYILLGWLYGVILDKVRAHSGTNPGQLK